MRMLALLSDGFGGQGGIARFNSDLMTAVAGAPGMREIRVLPRFAGSGGRLPGGVVQEAPIASRIGWALRALSIAARERFDVIFCGHINAAPLAATIGRSQRRPMWLQVHGIEAWHRRGWSIRAAVENADLVTSVSRFTRTRLLGWADIEPYRVKVLPNTVASGFTPRPRRPDLIARHDLAGARVILTVGRLAPSERYKGHDRIIAALPAVLARQPDAIYLVVGGGDDAARLQELASRLGVSHRVRFAGEVSPAELADYFALADLFAMPSTGEGFGIVFLEAMRMGLPVVAGSRDGSRDPLADGRLGRLVDPADPRQLTDALVDGLTQGIACDAPSVGRFDFDHFSAHVHDLVKPLG